MRSLFLIVPILLLQIFILQPLSGNDYFNEMTDAEREDIAFIVTTLAEKSVFSLPFQRKKLQAAGDRLGRVHPMRQLLHTFTTPELRKAIHKVHGRSFIWGQYWEEMTESLEARLEGGQTPKKVMTHFAQALKADTQVITTSVESRNWDLFLKELLNSQPNTLKI